LSVPSIAENYTIKELLRSGGTVPEMEAERKCLEKKMNMVFERKEKFE
jgi:hypothetical protein